MAAEHVTDARTYAPPPALERLQGTALVVGIVCLVIVAAGSFINAPNAFRAYLLGFTFWTGISVGSMAIMMLHHLSGGGWGVVLRRIFEAATRVLPLLAVLFIPVAVGMFTNHLYSWALAPMAEVHANKKMGERRVGEKGWIPWAADY